MKTIPLTQDKVALVDDEDFERVNRFKWFVYKSTVFGGNGMEKPLLSDKTIKCPECQSQVVAKIPGGFACNKCGHHWLTRPVTIPQTSRGDMLKRGGTERGPDHFACTAVYRFVSVLDYGSSMGGGGILKIMQDLPVERCDRCGRKSREYSVRVRGPRDQETGYQDEELVCGKCEQEEQEAESGPR